MVTAFVKNGNQFAGYVNGKAFTGHYEENGEAVIDSPSNLTSAEFAAIVAYL